MLADFGDWSHLVRELADYNVSRYPEILRWPLAEALAAYENRIRAAAQQRYDLDVLLWAILAQSGAIKKKKPPDVPPILKS